MAEAIRTTMKVGDREFDVVIEKLKVSWVCFFYEGGKNLGFQLDTMGMPSNAQIEKKIKEELFGGTVNEQTEDLS